MADFSRFGAHLRLAHFSRFDPKSLTLAASTPPSLRHIFQIIVPTQTTVCQQRRITAMPILQFIGYSIRDKLYFSI